MDHVSYVEIKHEDYVLLGGKTSPVYNSDSTKVQFTCIRRNIPCLGDFYTKCVIEFDLKDHEDMLKQITSILEKENLVKIKTKWRSERLSSRLYLLIFGNITSNDIIEIQPGSTLYSAFINTLNRIKHLDQWIDSKRKKED